MRRSSVRAVCFDLDGTLFDDRQYARAGLVSAAAELRRRTGVDLTEELLSAYFREGHREATFDVVLSAAGLADDHVPALVSAYHDNDASLVPYADAAATLERLESDYPIGVITGGTNGREKLARLGLDDQVAAVIVTAERRTRSGPAPFVEMADRFDVPHESMAFVGDRPGLDFPSRTGSVCRRFGSCGGATRTPSPGTRPRPTLPSSRWRRSRRYSRGSTSAQSSCERSRVSHRQ
ncbi:HAD family hydrolase [Halomicroarcula sp. GCM10025894]|uniref:HAD family hydrolase n=1 Tax=Halomicroarcula sp. GCM10025894 TaxID=3252673 RepID=UPI003623D99A